jgi:hypothetical protein
MALSQMPWNRSSKQAIAIISFGSLAIGSRMLPAQGARLALTTLSASVFNLDIKQLRCSSTIVVSFGSQATSRIVYAASIKRRFFTCFAALSLVCGNKSLNNPVGVTVPSGSMSR